MANIVRVKAIKQYVSMISILVCKNTNNPSLKRVKGDVLSKDLFLLTKILKCVCHGIMLYLFP